MGNEKFIIKCKRSVADYANENPDKTGQTQITVDDVFVIWSCKMLQNNKALLSTTVSDGMYYELAYNSDKSEICFDTYRKWENKTIKVQHILGSFFTQGRLHNERLLVYIAN